MQCWPAHPHLDDLPFRIAPDHRRKASVCRKLLRTQAANRGLRNSCAKPKSGHPISSILTTNL